MLCFRGQRGLAESQKNELAQTPVLISCADQWTSVAVPRSYNMNTGNGALLPSVVNPHQRETWSGSLGQTPPSPCGELAWVWIHDGCKNPLWPPCSSLSPGVLPEAFLWLRQDVFWTPLAPLRCSVRASGTKPPPHCMTSLIEMAVMSLLCAVCQIEAMF